MSLRQCQAAVSSREFALWRAAYDLEPWGDLRDDRRAAFQIAATGAAPRGVAVDPAKALDMINPWGKGVPESSLPDSQTLREKIRCFNAGIAAAARKRK